jgi:hypothetical protein
MKKSVSSPEGQPFFEVGLNVLGYEEDGQWVALALEMDIKGYGPTFRKAVDDLYDLVVMQVSFALHKGQPEMILKSAEPIWFERFAALKIQLLSAIGREPRDTEFRIADLPFPPPAVIAKRQAEYNPVDA